MAGVNARHQVFFLTGVSARQQLLLAGVSARQKFLWLETALDSNACGGVGVRQCLCAGDQSLDSRFFAGVGLDSAGISGAEAVTAIPDMANVAPQTMHQVQINRLGLSMEGEQVRLPQVSLKALSDLQRYLSWMFSCKSLQLSCHGLCHLVVGEWRLGWSSRCLLASGLIAGGDAGSLWLLPLLLVFMSIFFSCTLAITPSGLATRVVRQTQAAGDGVSASSVSTPLLHADPARLVHHSAAWGDQMRFSKRRMLHSQSRHLWSSARLPSNYAHHTHLGQARMAASVPHRSHLLCMAWA